MDVSASQISCGHSNVKFFWCGICHRLALAPRIHDGGYGQIFCRKVFCSTCVDSIALNPAAETRLDSNGNRIYICPSGDCLKSFVPPYFRFMSEAEENLYESLRIECLSCHHFFTPYRYSLHQLNCSRVTPNVLPSVVHNAMASGTSQKRINYLINYESRWKIRSINHGSIVDHEASLANVPDGSSISIMTSDLERGSISVPKCSDAGLFLAAVAKKLEVPSNSIDVSTMVHRSLLQSGSLEIFGNGLPKDVPLTVVERRETLLNPEYGGYWLYLNGYKRSIDSVVNEYNPAGSSSRAYFG